MSTFAADLVYGLCLLTCLACTGLLTRAWLRSRSKLLLYTAIAFGFLSLNNLLLVANMVVFPDAYLMPFRQVSTALALGVLIYGFVWETEA
jgi:hypothetical protein